MKLLARIAAPLLIAGAAVVVISVPSAADHGCVDAYADALASNPHTPTPSVNPFPPAVDTAPVVDYALYDVSATAGFGACVRGCVSGTVTDIATNPHTPTPSVNPFPPAVDTAPIVTYATHDLQTVGEDVYCIGYHDIAE